MQHGIRQIEKYRYVPLTHSFNISTLIFHLYTQITAKNVRGVNNFKIA